ncbi:MAG: molybdenum cofactor synthesis domain-containing protein [Bacteroidota bacterium]|nr:molybdenum cofactor synthesis domain-containing protein [Bacteroidota bacterium]
MVKSPLAEIILTDQGIEGDAHAGPHHRQVSLLAMESIRKYEENTSSKVPMGGFGENITTEGFALHRVHPLDRFLCGEVILEITQVGKKCHGNRCAIYKDTGECIMPDEGIFCRVLQGGRLKPGDQLEYHPKQFDLKVITLSDRAAAGIYADRSGILVLEDVDKWFQQKGLALHSESRVLPDEKESFSLELTAAIGKGTDLIITTGSTGLGSRDIAPEVAAEHMEKEIPGIMDMIRVKYGSVNPNALLSRSVAGIAGKTLIFVLPGSTRAVREYLEEILKSLWHMILMVNNIDSH